MGKNRLTQNDNLVYNFNMFGDAIIIVLRICLVMVVGAFLWRLFEPKTQQARILRAGILVIGLLITWVVVRAIGA